MVDGLSLYSYVRNNPLTRTDPSGRQSRVGSAENKPKWYEYALAPVALAVAGAAFVLTGLTGGEDKAHAPRTAREVSKASPRLSTPERAVNLVPLFAGGVAGGGAKALGGGVLSEGLAFGGTQAAGDLLIHDIRRDSYSDPSEYALSALGGGLLGITGLGAFRLLGRSPSRYNRASDIELRRVSTGGTRGEIPLSEAQRQEIGGYIQELNRGIKSPLDFERVRFVDSTRLNTSYGPSFDLLQVGADVLPRNVGVGTLTANSRVSSRGAIGHELVGHREA